MSSRRHFLLKNPPMAATGMIPGDRGKEKESWFPSPLPVDSKPTGKAASPAPLAGVMTGQLHD
jgi:hypothetical protein